MLYYDRQSAYAGQFKPQPEMKQLFSKMHYMQVNRVPIILCLIAALLPLAFKQSDRRNAILCCDTERNLVKKNLCVDENNQLKPPLLKCENDSHGTLRVLFTDEDTSVIDEYGFLHVQPMLFRKKEIIVHPNR